MHPAAELYLSRNRDAFHTWVDSRLSSAPMAASEPAPRAPRPSPLRPAPTPGPDLKLAFPPAPLKPWRKLPIRRTR